MIAETISSACFILLVVVFCCMIKIYTVVQNIRPSWNERVRGLYVRAERGAIQLGTCNNSTYSRSQARRRQPQIHDERFGWQSKTNFPYVSFYSKIIFFFAFTAFKHSSCLSSFVFFLDLIWDCVNHIHGSFRSELITCNWKVLE